MEVGLGEDRKDAGMSHIAYKNQGGGISIVQTARGGGISIMVSELNPPLIPPLAGGAMMRARERRGDERCWRLRRYEEEEEEELEAEAEVEAEVEARGGGKRCRQEVETRGGGKRPRQEAEAIGEGEK